MSVIWEVVRRTHHERGVFCATVRALSTGLRTNGLGVGGVGLGRCFDPDGGVVRPSVGPSTGLRTNGLGAGLVPGAVLRLLTGGVLCDRPLALRRGSGRTDWRVGGCWLGTVLRPLAGGVFCATVRWPFDGAQDERTGCWQGWGLGWVGR